MTTAIGGNDTKEEIRKKVFEEELDYVSIHGCTAGETIYRDMISMLGDE